MTTLAIGFANKFYTLWNITEETKPLGNGRSYMVTHYTFIKNISFDKETALAKYPEAILNENLRGKTTSWNTTKEVWDNVDTFRFGKYNGQKINEVNDLGYTQWYWDQVTGEHKQYISEYLKEHGYEIRCQIIELTEGKKIANQYLMSPEALENERKDAAEFIMLVEKCKNGEPFEVVPTKNLDDEGEFYDGNITYKFENFKVMYYNGYPYGLPVDAKGKSKRIKNKNLKITKYTYDVDNNHNVITIICKDFEISK